MTTNTAPNALAVALQRLETNLETPVVPGELSTWIRNLRESSDAVGRLLHDSVEDSHEERFRQISEQDPELLPRVQQLREEDQELLRDLEIVARAIANLDEQNGDRVANQAHSNDKSAEIVQLGLAFVIRARTQDTWHMEAYQRDRGVGDSCDTMTTTPTYPDSIPPPSPFPESEPPPVPCPRGPRSRRVSLPIVFVLSF